MSQSCAFLSVSQRIFGPIKYFYQARISDISNGGMKLVLRNLSHGRVVTECITRASFRASVVSDDMLVVLLASPEMQARRSSYMSSFLQGRCIEDVFTEIRPQVLDRQVNLTVLIYF